MSSIGYICIIAAGPVIACGSRSPLTDPAADPVANPEPDGSTPSPGASCPTLWESPPVCPTGSATLVPGRDGIALRGDAANIVYATSAGGMAGPASRLEASPLAGGAPSLLHTFSENANPFAWTLRGGAVYLNDGAGHALGIRVDGSAKTTLYSAPLPFRAWHFAADESWLYFGLRDNKAGSETIHRLSLAGGTPELLSELAFSWDYSDSSPNQDVELAVDDCSIYWLHKPTIPQHGGSQLDGAVYRISKSGGGVVELLGGLADPSGLSLTDDSVWLMDRGQATSPDDDRLIGAGKDGSPRVPLTFGPNPVALFLLDEHALLYVLYGPPGNLGAKTGWWTRPLDAAGTPSLIASASLSPGNDYAAWIDRDCRLLYSVGHDLIRQVLP